MPKIHQKKIEKIRQELHSAKMQSGSKQSNTMRRKEYASISNETRNLKRVLDIDEKNKVAWVEPSVTMEELVATTIPYGLIPEVVPEFKGITVGGAINGAALESSSHRYGQFNDTCNSYEVMVGDGSIIWASDQENKELFYGISSSYGTLGTLLSAKIRLVEARGYVKLHYYHCSLKEVFSYLKAQSADFMEAIVYTSDHAVAITGNFVEQPDAPVISLSPHWSPWFYSHAKNRKQDECISLSDYIFRHDRGAFWMGGFAPNPKMSLSYLSHKASLFLGDDWDYSEKFLPSQCSPNNPGIFFRSLLGWLMDSRKLYASLHRGSERWFEQKFAIQDFYLPFRGAFPFTQYALEKYKIQPIWICPVISTTQPQFFSPHYSTEKELLFDIGIYGLPANASGPKAVKDLEELCTSLKGRKMFYCHTYFTEEEFWNLYPYNDYAVLRKKYHLEKLSPEITKKVLK